MSKTSDRYVKVVAWSEEDQCYVGRCPGLMLGGVQLGEKVMLHSLKYGQDRCHKDAKPR